MLLLLLLLLLLLIIIICVITIMRGINNYIPETNHVSSVYSVAAVLNLQFVLHVMLFRMLSMFCIFTLALSIVREQCPKFFFVCFLISCFFGMLLGYYLNDFEMVPAASIITGITLLLLLLQKM